MSYFDFTGETKVVDGVTVHQIVATADIPHLDVSAGEEGGYIQNANNLANNAWVGKTAVVMEGALVDNGAHVTQDATVKGNAYVSGEGVVISCDAIIAGNAYISGDVWVDGRPSIMVHGHAVIGENARLIATKGEQIQCFGNSIIAGNATIDGVKVNIGGRTIITDNAVVHMRNGTIVGNTCIGGNVHINVAKCVILEDSLNISGNHRLLKGRDFKAFTAMESRRLIVERLTK